MDRRIEVERCREKAGEVAAGGASARGRKMAISWLGKSMFKCATTWLRPPSGSVISLCNNARRDYLRRRWWRASSSGDRSSFVRWKGGRDHEWKGWEVVSLSTHADGYLSWLINDAYVDRYGHCLSCGKRNSLPWRLYQPVSVSWIGPFIRGVGAARLRPHLKKKLVIFYSFDDFDREKSLSRGFWWH